MVKNGQKKLKLIKNHQKQAKFDQNWTKMNFFEFLSLKFLINDFKN